MSCLKSNFKIYIKINIKIAPTCFFVVTPSPGSVLYELAKVTAGKIVHYKLVTHNILEIGVYVFLLFNRTTLQVFVTYLIGALYVHPL